MMQIAAPPSSVTDTAHFTAAILSNREWRLIAKLRPKASPFFVKYISDERVPASEYKHAPQNKGDHKMIRAILRAAIPVCCLATSASAQDVQRIAVNGTELAYVETGKGDPVIFVHGGLQDYRMWAGHLSKFSDRYRVIAYSRRNNFPNDVSTDGMSGGAADAHGEDLVALVRALGLQKVRVVGHSSGARGPFLRSGESGNGGQSRAQRTPGDGNTGRHARRC
jgi:hypothetical protein